MTDAGMHALWNPFRFTGITDYQTWETRCSTMTT